MNNLDHLESQKYISLETYRKNETSVRTPVWFTIKDDLVYVVTRSQTWKVKRLKNNKKVKIAACTIKGKITGQWMQGTATILTDQETEVAVSLRDKKYGFMAKIARFLSKNKGDFFAFSIKIH